MCIVRKTMHVLDIFRMLYQVGVQHQRCGAEVASFFNQSLTAPHNASRRSSSLFLLFLFVVMLEAVLCSGDELVPMESFPYGMYVASSIQIHIFYFAVSYIRCRNGPIVTDLLTIQNWCLLRLPMPWDLHGEFTDVNGEHILSQFEAFESMTL
ncbi:uncharacterized protein LOC128869295 [Anastrepha ludens]|uniref:uncharacterized protein LOC128869295 n=1 Tax=Anastrepha ludens TaxID=28586 RepID=UPI0023B0483A|nr:uncharacterized protein LOC128869295 [Anastrepha ludens]